MSEDNKQIDIVKDDTSASVGLYLEPTQVSHRNDSTAVTMSSIENTAANQYNLVAMAVQNKASDGTLNKILDMFAEQGKVQAHALGVSAVSSFQKQFKPIVSTGANYQIKKHYSTLADILGTVTPALERCGLALTFSINQYVREGVDYVMATAHLKHAGGYEQSSSVEIEVYKMISTGGKRIQSPAQEVGTAITYAKRYAAMAVCGIAPSENPDDNNGYYEDQYPTAQQVKQEIIAEQAVKGEVYVADDVFNESKRQYIAFAESNGGTEALIKKLAVNNKKLSETQLAEINKELAK